MSRQGRHGANPLRGANNLSGSANFRQAIDIEDACHAVNRINARVRRDLISSVEREKAKITLSSSLDAWLKKDIP